MDNLSFILELFPNNLKVIINQLDDSLLTSVTEIRIRRRKPLIIYVDKEPYFISKISMSLIKTFTNTCIIINDEQFNTIVNNFCNNSYHTQMSKMVKGFITLENGSRVGIASSAVYKNNEIGIINEISSLNIRISHDIKNCSLNLLKQIYTDHMPGTIIAGPPSSGKTTLLRDIAFQISSGYNGRYNRVTIIDERGELSSGYNVGINTDVLKNFNKEDGVEIAVRTLSPEIIICDEIGSDNEVNLIKKGFYSGVNFIVSAHLEAIESFLKSAIIHSLIECGVFEYLVFINKNYEYSIISLRNHDYVENSRRHFDNYLDNFDVGNLFEF